MVTPPCSPIAGADSASSTTGVASPSRILSSRAAGAAIPLPPLIVAVTRTRLSGPAASSSCATIATSPLLVISPAAIVSVEPVCVKYCPAGGSSGAAATVTTASSLDTPLSVAHTVATPPCSPMVSADSFSAAVGVGSSSAIVSGVAAGAATPLPPLTRAATCSVLSGASTASSTAVIFTSPPLAVCPAAMVSTRFAPSVKSSTVAGGSGAAVTHRVVSALEAALSVAVITLSPCASPIRSGDSSSSRVGVASSSRISSTRAAGAMAPLPPATVAATRTCLSGESVASSSAAMRTVPVLAVCPAVIVSVVPCCAKYDPAAGACGVAATVSVVSSLEARSSVACTRLAPPFSAMDGGASTSVTRGVVSPSRMVSNCAAGAAIPLPPATVAATRTCLSGESTLSSSASMRTVPALAVCPAAIVSVAPCCTK